MRFIQYIFLAVLTLYSPLGLASPILLESNIKGTQWTPINTDTYPEPIAWNPYYYVATKNNDWIIISAGANYYYNHGFWEIAVAKSTDQGTTWTKNYTKVAHTPGIASNDKSWVIPGDYTIEYSADGKQWESMLPIPQQRFERFSSIAANNTTYMLATIYFRNNQDEPEAGLLTSNDGTHWNWLTSASPKMRGDYAQIKFVTWDGKKWLGVATTEEREAVVFSTVTGTNDWVFHTVPNGITSLISIAAHDKEWIAIGTTSNTYVMIRSTDEGAHWQILSPVSAESVELNKIVYHSSQWVAVGRTGNYDQGIVPTILTSTDGIHWNSITFPTFLKGANQASLRDITWTEKGWIVVGR
ncbi:hypothetical protein AYO45_03370 [Gammaproteobacteria bacterium SCGC AG-212-F23]|nr:hypothetical protein AYO45_03370 [Gammaproteobacteria bacterium SCGC AG-212-F23]